jgi:DNA-binding CsgD family transcriptional regulator
VVGRFSRRLEIMYEMTAAEAQLTEALVNGKSLQEFADSRRVSMNTVRTQLKSASAKTGARRQADLVRMILTGPAIFKPPS